MNGEIIQLIIKDLCGFFAEKGFGSLPYSFFENFKFSEGIARGWLIVIEIVNLLKKGSVTCKPVRDVEVPFGFGSCSCIGECHR